MPSRSPERIDAQDLEECRALLREGSKSFAAAARLLPHRVRDDATVLYAFCRVADDAVDTHDGGAAAVSQLGARLDAIYRGAPEPFASDRALAAVVAHHALPRTLLDALIEGFSWDAGNRRYASMGELEAYAARVAGTVGAMMSVLMGTRAPSTIARACDLGVAMQLTNIARDVGDDARIGRLYLPLDRLRARGVDLDRWLIEPSANEGVRGVVREVLERAAALYKRADLGIAQLPSDCRPGICAARLIYADIGRVVRDAGFDSVSRRAIVPAWRKAWLLARAYAAAFTSPRGSAAEPLASTRYLVDAVAASEMPIATASRPAPAHPRWWQVTSRALWLIDLFEQVERRNRFGAAAGLSRTAADSSLTG